MTILTANLDVHLAYKKAADFFVFVADLTLGDVFEYKNIVHIACGKYDVSGSITLLHALYRNTHNGKWYVRQLPLTETVYSVKKATLTVELEEKPGA